MTEPDIGMLASAVGLAGVVWVVMAVVRTLVGETWFDKWGPTIAVVIGILFAEAYVLATGPVNGTTLLQGLLVGLFGGWMSQNANAMIQRLLHPPA
jgi:hypothetical protein